MKTSTKLAVAFVTLAGVGAAALTAQADSRWHRDGGPQMQQAQGGAMMHQGGHHRGGHHRGGGRHMQGMIESFDLDDDGKLSQEEIDRSRGERFSSFDADGNQSLTLAEYEKLWLDAMREAMVDRFQELDADGDAQVTAEEFKRPFAKVVRHMDRNDDGVIDDNDRQRRHQGPQGGRMMDDDG
jgi:EF hand